MERLFQWLDHFKNANLVRAAFGEPYTLGDRTVIPVARVTYTHGGTVDDDGAPSEGHGNTKPVAVISVSPEGVRVEEIVDRTSMMAVGAGLATVVGLLVGWRLRQRCPPDRF